MSQMLGGMTDQSPTYQPEPSVIEESRGLELVDDDFVPPDEQLVLEFDNGKDGAQRGSRVLTEEQQQIALAHLDIVHPIARSYHGTSFTRGDLEGEGALGLVRSTTHYDPGYGAPFEAFATVSARGAMTDALRDRDKVIRGHRKDSPPLLRVKDAVAELSDGVKRAPDKLVAEKAHMSEVDMRHYRDAPRTPYVDSIYKPILTQAHGGTMELIDLLVGTEDHADNVNTAVDVSDSLGMLKQSQAAVIRYRFGISPYEGDHSQAETAEFFGLSRAAVYRQEKAAKHILRGLLEEDS